MEVTLTKASKSDFKKAENLFDLYVSEMSKITGRELHPSKKSFVYDKLFNVYWEKDDHFPYLIFYGGKLIGFSFVRRYPADKSLYDMGHFFIHSNFKGKGLGRKAFLLTLEIFSGNWLTRVLIENQGAFQFWKKIISEKTKGNYLISQELDEELNMHFIRYTVNSSLEFHEVKQT